MEIEEVTGVILAGGENRRFPMLKAFIEVEGTTIIERNLNILKGIFDEVFISTNMPEKYFYLGVPLIGDVFPSRGPMSGIYSLLINAKSDCIFVIACDMPFVKMELVSFIWERHIEVFKGGLHKGDLKPPLCVDPVRKGLSNRVDATIPVYNGQPQPLLGVYCKTAFPRLGDCVLNEKTSMRRLLNGINTHFIEESDIMTIDPDGRSFVNINTMEDYERIVNSE